MLYLLCKYTWQHLSNVTVGIFFMFALFESWNRKFIILINSVRHFNPFKKNYLFISIVVYLKHLRIFCHSLLSPKYCLNKKNHCVINWDWEGAFSFTKLWLLQNPTFLRIMFTIHMSYGWMVFVKLYTYIVLVRVV